MVPRNSRDTAARKGIDLYYMTTFTENNWSNARSTLNLLPCAFSGHLNDAAVASHTSKFRYITLTSKPESSAVTFLILSPRALFFPSSLMLRRFIGWRQESFALSTVPGGSGRPWPCALVRRRRASSGRRATIGGRGGGINISVGKVGRYGSTEETPGQGSNTARAFDDRGVFCVVSAYGMRAEGRCGGGLLALSTLGPLWSGDVPNCVGMRPQNSGASTTKGGFAFLFLFFLFRTLWYSW